MKAKIILISVLLVVLISACNNKKHNVTESNACAIKIDLSQIDIKHIEALHDLEAIDSIFLKRYVLNNNKILTLYDVPLVLYSDNFYRKFYLDSTSKAQIKKFYDGNRYYTYEKNICKNSKAILVVYPGNEIVYENLSLFLLTFSDNDSLLSTIQIAGKYRAESLNVSNNIIYSLIYSDTLIHTRKLSVTTISDVPSHPYIYDTTDFFYKYRPNIGFFLYKRIYNWESR